MPNAINVSASSMTGLLGAVEASKAAHSLASKKVSKSNGDTSLNQEFDISRFKKGSLLKKDSYKIGDFSQRHSEGSNKGVQKRAMKDKMDRKYAKMSSAPPSVQDQLAMEALERKSKIYEATILGKKGGLTDKQLEASPLDIEAKRATLTLQQHLGISEFDSDQEEESEEDCSKASVIASSSSLPPKSFTGRLNSATDPSGLPVLGEDKKSEEDWIEMKDEFGRDVLISASEIKPSKLDPQRTMAFSQTESASHLQEIGAEYGPQTSFPVLELPFPHSIKKSTADEPIEKYFDPKAERRQLGTAFYALSSNPEERQRQQDELRAREAATNHARAAAASTESESQLTPAQIALEARKRQLQLKREELARKRLKKAEGDPAL